MKLRNPFKHMFDGFKLFDEEEKKALQLEIDLKEQFKRDRIRNAAIKKHMTKVTRRRITNS